MNRTLVSMEGKLDPFTSRSGSRLGRLSDRIAGRTKVALSIAAGFVVLLWAVECWDIAMSVILSGKWGGGVLDQGLGIHPRSLSGLPGIVLMPFLHKDFGHLAANTFPIFFLSAILAMDGWRRFATATIWIILLTGAFVWLFGSTASHVGASGLAFGYLGCLLTKGFMERRVIWIAVAVSMVVLRVFLAVFQHGVLGLGQMFTALLPAPEMSWSAHFFGLCSGVFVTWWLFRRNPKDGAKWRLF